MFALSPRLTPWELAAENIAVQIRWFGLLLGYLYINGGSGINRTDIPNAILGLGAIFTVTATIYFRMGRVLLGRYPLVISAMEAFFITLLCYFESGLDSAFRFYYLLSLICCAIRYSSWVTAVTCLLDCIGYTLLYHAQDPAYQNPFELFLMIVVLIWITWASTAMSDLLKGIGDHLSDMNQSLRKNQTMLEARIADRTRELQDTQALLLHQEKMAAFGLLAAGIAHEVGNPLTSISSIVQILEKRDLDEYTRERLRLVGGQLQRIQTILRELINFSRPASVERSRIHLAGIVQEALDIAKYYKDMKSRTIASEVPHTLPLLFGVRDQLVQVLFNLILNAIDATARGGKVTIRAVHDESHLLIEVEDNGSGISAEHQERLFTPYFTTKKQGTGLGLFVTYKLISEHGGQVKCESSTGSGTIFRIHLPIAQPLQGDHHASPPRQTDGPSTSSG